MINLKPNHKIKLLLNFRFICIKILNFKFIFILSKLKMWQAIKVNLGIGGVFFWTAYIYGFFMLIDVLWDNIRKIGA